MTLIQQDSLPIITLFLKIIGISNNERITSNHSIKIITKFRKFNNFLD